MALLDNKAKIQALIEGINALPDAGGAAEAVIESLSVTANGTYAAPDGVDGYSPVNVNVPIPDGYIKPTGTLDLTENGTHDVTQYASVAVNVPTGGGNEVNTGTCTIEIVPPSTSNYYAARETVAADGSISYAITRSYTGSKITVTARCDSTMYIQASTINGAEVTAGQVLHLTSGYGVAYKTPDTDGTTAQITLLA